MLNSAPYLETLEAVLQQTPGLLIAVPHSATASGLDIGPALASLNLELWQLEAPDTRALPNRMGQGEFHTAFVLLLKAEPDTPLAQQALAGDLLALSQFHGLRCWHVRPEAPTQPRNRQLAPLDPLPPKACIALLQANHLSQLTRQNICHTILGRWGRKLASDRMWAQANACKPLHVAFIHGFQGSARGQKARYLEDFCLAHQLPFMALARSSEENPAQSLQEYREQLQVWQHQPVLLIGSSLGGFFARQLAHEFKYPSVLINPSVMPQTTLLGRLPDAACRLFNAYPMSATPDMHLMLAKDDDLLDHTLTVLALKGAHQHWHEQQGHRWRDNALIGQRILSLNREHRKHCPTPPIDTSPAPI